MIKNDELLTFSCNMILGKSSSRFLLRKDVKCVIFYLISKYKKHLHAGALFSAYHPFYRYYVKYKRKAAFSVRSYIRMFQSGRVPFKSFL